MTEPIKYQLTAACEQGSFSNVDKYYLLIRNTCINLKKADNAKRKMD